MYFPVFGTIHQAMKKSALTMKWQQRMTDPYMRAREEEESQSARMKKQAENVRKRLVIASIDGKLKAGIELTDEELRYLKIHDPELYQEAMDIKRERREYKKELAACKTKEDVRKLFTSKIQGYATQAGAIQSNPGMPRGEKLKQMDKILRRVMGLQNEHMRFTGTQEYNRLPSGRETGGGKKGPEKSGAGLESIREGDAGARADKLRAGILEWAAQEDTPPEDGGPKPPPYAKDEARDAKPDKPAGEAGKRAKLRGRA